MAARCQGKRLHTVCFYSLLLTGCFADSVPKIRPFQFSKDIILGKKEKLYCTVLDGEGPFSFLWSKDGMSIDNSPLLRIQAMDEETSVLQIPAVMADHVGNYTCTVRGAHGTDSVTTYLLLDVPPIWMTEPNDVSAARGSNVVVDCTAKGYPPPHVSWTRQTESSTTYIPVAQDGHPKRSIASNGSLTLYDVTESDAGLYLCEVYNGLGAGLRKEIHISVHAPPRVKERSKLETVRSGLAARLTCDVTGEHVVVSWKKDGRALDKNLTNVETSEQRARSGVTSELLIRESNKSDSGVYTCHVQNSYGHHKLDIRLDVLEPPSAPRGLRAAAVTSRSVKLSWLPPAEGDEAVVSYSVRYWRDEANKKTLHQVTLQAPTTSYQVAKLHPGTSYAATVLAQNGVGVGDPAPILTVRTTEEAPTGAPTDVVAEPVGSRGIRVTWKAPPPRKWNGQLKGYYVGYREAQATSQAYFYKTLDAGERGQLLLEGLSKAKQYALVVQAFNAQGPGPLSQEVRVRTLEGDPPSSPSIALGEVSSNEVRINWHNTQKDISQYIVMYREEDNPDWRAIHLPQDKASYVLAGLRNAKRHELRAAAYNNFGRSEFSPIIRFSTLDLKAGVPGSAGSNGGIIEDNAPFYLRPYVVIPVAASVAVVATTVVLAWVCYRRMMLRQDVLVAQQTYSTLRAARHSYAEPASYSPPLGLRPEDTYDVPWDVNNGELTSGHATTGNYTRLKSRSGSTTYNTVCR